MSVGIDYGMGTTNRDTTTGIRYGVISQNSVLQAWSDSAEADYGEPTCPKCGGERLVIAGDYRGDIPEHYSHGPGCSDYVCDGCELIFDSQEAFGDEPRGWNYSGDGYEASDCLDSDIIITKSLYYTLAPFCSPCVPGAGNLDDACGDGIETYCFGHDWFEDGKAPYRVFSVETRQEVCPAETVGA